MGECGDRDSLSGEICGQERRVRLEGEAYFEVTKDTCQTVYRGGERDGGEGVRDAI